MKYSASLYAKALDEALADPQANQAEMAKNFLELVRKNGDEAHLRKILDEASRLARGRVKMRKVTVESARTLAKSQEAMVKSFLKPGDVVEYEINPDLIAGVKIIVNDENQLDGSLRSKLDALFEN